MPCRGVRQADGVHLIEIATVGRDVELVADRCWQAGAAGIWELEGAVRVGVDDGAVPSFLGQLADLGPVDVTETEAVELVGTEVVLEIAGRQVELWVPPTVFGDGRHPTTATCLDLLDGSIEPGSTVLDVGCGAGALALGAAIRDGIVTAIDIDPDAVAATADNAARNGLEVTATTTPLAAIDARFDVVVANMTSGALAPLVPDLVRRTRLGGILVVSGMLEAQWPAIRAAIGGHVHDVRVADGWLSAVVTPR